MSNIFDGIQRPLEVIYNNSQSPFIPRGADVPALNRLWLYKGVTTRERKWLYTPLHFKEGDLISGGDIFGVVYENELIPEHNIMCPPNVKGTVMIGNNCHA